MAMILWNTSVTNQEWEGNTISGGKDVLLYLSWFIPLVYEAIKEGAFIHFVQDVKGQYMSYLSPLSSITKTSSLLKWPLSPLS